MKFVTAGRLSTWWPKNKEVENGKKHSTEQHNTIYKHAPALIA